MQHSAERDREVRACLAQMRALVMNTTPQNQIGLEFHVARLSDRVSTLTAEMSLPEIWLLSEGTSG